MIRVVNAGKGVSSKSKDYVAAMLKQQVASYIEWKMMHVAGPIKDG